MASALSLKVRTGDLDIAGRDDAAAAWGALRRATFSTVRVEQAHFETAARFVARHELGLRAPDGLHLAIAWHHGVGLATLDARLRRAAVVFGVEAETIGASDVP